MAAPVAPNGVSSSQKVSSSGGEIASKLGPALQMLRESSKRAAELNQQLVQKMLEAHPAQLRAGIVAEGTPEYAQLKKIADEFHVTHRAEYQTIDSSLERATQQVAKLLSEPKLDEEIVRWGEVQRQLPKETARVGNEPKFPELVLEAHQRLAGTKHSNISLSWANRLISSREGGTPSQQSLYKVFAGLDKDFPKTLDLTIGFPSLPVAAQMALKETGDESKAADKLNAKFGLVMTSALRTAAMASDAKNILNTTRDKSGSAVERTANYYRGAHWLAKGAWGAGSTLGIGVGVLEIYEGRYVNGARNLVPGTVGLATLGAAVIQDAKENPGKGGWVATGARLAAKKAPWVAAAGNKVTEFAPIAAIATTGANLVEHSGRDPSVLNRAAVIGDGLSMTGATLSAVRVGLEKFGPKVAVAVLRLPLLRFGPTLGYLGAVPSVLGDWRTALELPSEPKVSKPVWYGKVPNDI